MFAVNSSRMPSHSQSSFTPDLDLPEDLSSSSRRYPLDYFRNEHSDSPETYYGSRRSTSYTRRDLEQPLLPYLQSFDCSSVTVTTTESQLSDRPMAHSPLDISPCSNHQQSGLMKPSDLPLMNTFPFNIPYTSHDPSSAISLSSITSSDSYLTASIASSSGQGSTAAPSKHKKSRREKPRIELAPDQPPTTQGKPRARVYVACLQCRTRKIRCDGAKPACHNCSRRATSNECDYDSTPKRRGPDKIPGARQRMARDGRDPMSDSLGPSRRRRRRTRESSASDTIISLDQRPPTMTRNPGISLSIPTALTDSDSISFGNCSPASSYTTTAFSSAFECEDFLELNLMNATQKGHEMPLPFDDTFDLSSLISYGGPTAVRSNIAELDENGNVTGNDYIDIVSPPSLSFSRKIWWESLLSLYTTPNFMRRCALTSSQRAGAAQSIASDLRFVFKASNYWFSFFHIPSFFSNFFDPVRRERMQPSLVLALLAISTFWQSSEIGLGSAGRERALRFREEAQGALEASVNAGWIDETLAQAAWLLAVFEVCAHPRHSSNRCLSALVMLDSIIRSLSLTSVDADDPTTTMFLPKSVPVVPERGQLKSAWFDSPGMATQSRQTPDLLFLTASHSGHSNAEFGCPCNSLTLGSHWPATSEHAPMWASTPAWKDSWSEAEIRKESCRRLCWSAMVTAAGHISYTTANRAHNPDLFIADPANYALLFSGESIARSPALSMSSGKDTVWALQDRCFLLWHACIRMRTDRSASDADKAQFATKAWLEADALEAALNKHTCSIERAFIFQSREYIFNTRMSISYEFQRYIPLATANISGLFHRAKAEEWLRHQATVSERFMHGLHTITGNVNNLLARRPFFVFWFMSQISRSLSLWQCDNTLTVALDVCKALLPAIDYLSALWPCPEQRQRYHTLRVRLDNACYAAGVGLPPPPNFSLPPPSSPEALV